MGLFGRRHQPSRQPGEVHNLVASIAVWIELHVNHEGWTWEAKSIDLPAQDYSGCRVVFGRITDGNGMPTCEVYHGDEILATITYEMTDGYLHSPKIKY